MSITANFKITMAALATAGAGIGGAFAGPAVDVPAILAIWVGLFIFLAADAGHQIDKGTATKVASSVLAGIALALTGIKVGAQVFAYTGIGTIPAVIGNCGLNASVTWVFGHVVARILRKTDIVDDWDELGKSILAAMLAVFGLSENNKDT